MEEEKKTRILVVDDEEDLCEILKFNLEAEGYEIDTAYSGRGLGEGCRQLPVASA